MDVRKALELFLAEDVGDGDITTEAVVEERAARAVIVARAFGILAGAKEGATVFRLMGCDAKMLVADGDRVSKGDVVMEATGNARDLLAAERVVLNIMTRMSGIATTTRNVVERARSVNPKVRIAATRKTTPGFRYFEKRAVVTGGGEPHRWGLNDAVIIKENHLVFVESPVEAIRRAREMGHQNIEIEATSHEMAMACAEGGADTIMLDNFQPAEATRTYLGLKEKHPSISVEISGGVDAGNVRDFAAHADVISIGALTHSAKALDLSMDIFPLVSGK
ncbi:MAG: carboxylating nicotinate-nucleotide diphosphorylase [Thermoplasmata archaeon]|nr:carboxylating nicotinate-nucleotide diphosphorylase [Thermoplasmata archaeon]